MIVGIVGCGFIGGALKKWMETHNSGASVRISDPPLGYNDSLAEVDVVFISIHIGTEPDGSQNLAMLEQIIKDLPDKPIFIRTTILPGTSEGLSRVCDRRVYFMPEFLTERTAYEDFCSQPMVFTAESDLLKEVFPGKEFIEMTSLEAEISKYAHNVFGALKVTYFNGIYDLCQRRDCDFEKVRRGCLLSGYINDVHTFVPGPDGRLGYGGKCFPKDVNALTKMVEGTPFWGLLDAICPLNARFRGSAD